MAPHLPAGIHFVPAHPVAGTEFRARRRLRRAVRQPLVHPHPAGGADAAAVERLAAFWRALGANVDTMTADHHDLVLAVTSHLPHLIAYTIVGTAYELRRSPDEVLKFSAGGFRDFTRIAASDPTMWRDMFLPTRTPCWKCSAASTRISRSSPARSGAAMATSCSSIFTRTRAIRRGIVAIGQDSPAPDFGRPHPDLPHEPLPRPYAGEE